MPPARPISIIGGGLAGLTLGIALRRRAVPVTVWEAGDYPRHRVCGEFISGNGQAVLARLGLLPRCLEAGAAFARTMVIVRGSVRSPVRLLPQAALCLSRYRLDALLAESFQVLGGDLRVNSRQPADAPAEGVVRASGRRTSSGKAGPRLFGVKAHVAAGGRLKLAADLEMHVGRDSYVGVNRINDGEVNVCGLFWVRKASRRPESKLDWLRGEGGSGLRERLAGMEFAPDSFCSVAGLQLKPQRAAALKECCIGDTLTMTPPITGNGMSMAFESAELAAEPLAAYSEGRLAWPAARNEVAELCDGCFSRRLAWARLLQWLMMTPAVQGPLGVALLRSGWLWQLLFRQTR